MANGPQLSPIDPTRVLAGRVAVGICLDPGLSDVGLADRVDHRALLYAAGVSFKTPKTASGERVISLPAAVIDALREHRRAQLELRLALGQGKPSDDALVFPRVDGRPQSSNAFSVAWIRTVRRLSVPEVTWHGLRHLSASLLLRHGVDLATASRRLGHSRPDTTARLYLHHISESDRHAAEALDKALGWQSGSIQAGWRQLPGHFLWGNRIA